MNPQNTNQQNQINPEKHIKFHVGIPGGFVRGAFLVVFGILIGGIIAYLIASSRFKVPSQTKSLTVRATGTVEMKASEAVITGYSYDTTRTYPTKNEADKVAKQDSEKVKGELVTAGIPNSAISITSYATPDYKYDYSQPVSLPTPLPEGGVSQAPYIPPSPSGYYPTTNVTVTLKTELIGKADQVMGVLDKYKLSPYTSYYATPSDSTRSEARKNALLDASKQIEDLKEIGNVKIGKIISLKDVTIRTDYQNPNYPQTNKIYLEQGSSTAPYQIILEIVYQLR